MDEPVATAPESLRTHAARGMAWSAAQSWGTAILSFAVFAALARLVRPADFGLIAMAGVFLALLDALIDLGLGVALIQRKTLDDAHISTAFWSAIAASLLGAAIVWAAAGAIAALYHQPDLASALRWLSLGLVVNGTATTQRALLERRLAFRPIALCTLLGAAAGGTVGIVMAVRGYGVWSLVAQVLTGAGVTAAALWSATTWRPSAQFSPAHFRDLFPFGASVLWSSVLTFVSRHSDDFIIGYFLGPTALGFYTVAYRILRILIMQLTKITSRVLLPAFARVQHQVERVRAGYYEVAQLTSLASFPVFLGVAATAPDLLAVLYGEQWRESAPIMRWLAVAGVVQTLAFFNSSVILALGHARWLLRFSVMLAAANVATFLIGVQWGAAGVAAAYTVVAFAFAPPLYMKTRQLVGIDYAAYVRRVAVPLCAALVMLAAVLGANVMLRESGAGVRLTIEIVVGALAYGAVIALLGRDIISAARTALRTMAVAAS